MYHIWTVALCEYNCTYFLIQGKHTMQQGQPVPKATIQPLGSLMKQKAMKEKRATEPRVATRYLTREDWLSLAFSSNILLSSGVIT